MVFPQLWISMSSIEREEEMGDSNVGFPLSQYIVLGVQVGILGISPILGKTSNDRLTHFIKWVNRSLDVFPRIGEIPKIPTCTPNTMYCERGNPTFESPISSSRSMLDMLIQSWGNTIRVFPATPSSWKDASFYQLRAEGAFLLSAKRENGKSRFIHIKSLAGEPCIIQSDLPDDVKVIGISLI